MISDPRSKLCLRERTRRVAQRCEKQSKRSGPGVCFLGPVSRQALQSPGGPAQSSAQPVYGAGYVMRVHRATLCDNGVQYLCASNPSSTHDEGACTHTAEFGRSGGGGYDLRMTCAGRRGCVAGGTVKEKKKTLCERAHPTET